MPAQARSAHVGLPKEIVSSRVVEHIETLFFVVIKLDRPTSHQFKTGEDTQQGKEKLTKGAPGISKLTIKVPIALLWVPLTNPSHRRMSKLDMPYICLGSIAPVDGFRKSFWTKSVFQASTKLTGRS